jgi:ElaB/YqjD/DUF883 family membrane-anchored ribosome-binding protein
MAGINLEGRAQLVVERERAQVVSTLEGMLELSRRSAEEAGVARQDAGITQSLQTPEQVQEGIQAVKQQQQQPAMVDVAEPEQTAPVEPMFDPADPRSTSPRPVLRPTEPDEDRVLPLFVPEDVQQDTGFMSSVETVSENLGIPSEELLRAMHFETGGTFSTSIKNPTGSATGLIQFIESTAESLGTSTAELAKMTREEQMQYVEKYLSPYKGRMKDFGDIYMAIHLPVAVGKSDDYVIYDNESLRTQAYKQNRGLDTNNDGKVTKGEAVARASRDTQ